MALLWFCCKFCTLLYFTLYVFTFNLKMILLKNKLVVTRSGLSMFRHNSRIGTATPHKHWQWFLCLPAHTLSVPCIPTVCVCLCCCFWLSWQGKWAGVWEGFILTVTRWSHCSDSCAICFSSTAMDCCRVWLSGLQKQTFSHTALQQQVCSWAVVAGLSIF